jgi:hypothetical protein
MKYSCLLALWLGLIGIAGAQPSDDAGRSDRASDRARIAAERQKLEADFKVAEAICFRQFFANACRDKLRPPYIAALADLRRQEILINELERKISAAEQLLKTEEKLNVQRQQQVDQALKVEQDAATQTERSQQREVDQGNAAEQAESNKASMGTRLESSQSKAAESVTKREQAAANVEAMRLRQAQAAKNRAEREQRLREDGPPTGKSLRAYP